MEKMVKLLSKISIDKYAHLFASIAIAVIIVVVDTQLFNRSALVAGVIAAFTTIIIGIGKELFDFFRGGAFDLDDLKFDAVGTIIGSLVCLFFI